MFKQRPKSFGHKLHAASLTRECAGNISALWKLFRGCLRESQVGYVFIIIDSIDYLQGDDSSEKGTVLANMRALVRDSNMLIKILLSRSLNLELFDPMEEQIAFMT